MFKLSLKKNLVENSNHVGNMKFTFCDCKKNTFRNRYYQSIFSSSRTKIDFSCSSMSVLKIKNTLKNWLWFILYILLLSHPQITSIKLSNKSREVNKLIQLLLYAGEKECIPSNFFRACKTRCITKQAPFIVQPILVKVIAQAAPRGGLIRSLRIWKTSPLNNKKSQFYRSSQFFFFFSSFLSPHSRLFNLTAK